jgi:hypothetical protein
MPGSEYIDGLGRRREVGRRCSSVGAFRRDLKNALLPNLMTSG